MVEINNPWNSPSGNWYKPSENLPPVDADIETSYDNGKTWDNSTSYMENRHCMMAGIAGGYGYFPEAGWGTNGNNGCDTGLICDPPDFWRFIKSA